MKALILIYVLLFIPASVPASEIIDPDPGFVGIYIQKTPIGNKWEHKLKLLPDLSYQYSGRQIHDSELNPNGKGLVDAPINKPKWKIEEAGIYKGGKCWHSSSPKIVGNIMFYKLNGKDCCGLLMGIGKHTLIKRIGGAEEGLCRGGIYEKK